MHAKVTNSYDGRYFMQLRLISAFKVCKDLASMIKYKMLKDIHIKCLPLRLKQKNLHKHHLTIYTAEAVKCDHSSAGVLNLFCSVDP